jgi:23S rRNA (cytosine1962-C5)-methyltransferase
MNPFIKSRVFLKKNEEKRIKDGHFWAFNNEVEKVQGEPENGEIVELYDAGNNMIGEGFYNKNSLITVRILERKNVEDIQSLFENRIRQAYNLRKEFYPERNSFRMVYSESDYLPGLIIDKYNNAFVLQIYSAGMEKNINSVVEILIKHYNAENIFTKNESSFRNLEFLPESDTTYLGSMKEEVIDDGTIKYKINFERGQKTGFYFDQCDNRAFVEKISKGKNFLDAFCNSGAFGLHAAKAGAKSVTFVDSSDFAITSAQDNFKLNKLKSGSEFITEDVFDFFNRSIDAEKKFDIVNVDPPAFAKNKKNLPVAKKGYEKLNKLALRLINDGGYLVTSSCSHYLSRHDFFDIIRVSARKAGKNLQQIYFCTASLDHPEIPAMLETSYLKFAVFKVHDTI